MFQSAAVSVVQAVDDAHYSQSQEREADRFGLMLLNDIYGHVAGATDFFARLLEQQNQKFAFLSSHPIPEKRVKKLQRLIEKHHYPIGKRSPLPSVLQ